MLVAAAIYCSKNLNVHPLYHISSNDLAVARLTIKRAGNDKSIIVCSSYFPYDTNENPPTTEFVTLIDYCKSNNLSLVTGITRRKCAPYSVKQY